MPQFAGLHDDGVLFVSAKSLASGEGYRILSLPEAPAQTKYPVLYPLYLSFVWKLNAKFPDNLQVGTLLSWLLLVVLLALAWRLYRDDGWTDWRVWVLVALLAVNPYLILFGCTLFSEVFFTCWVLAALLAARRLGVSVALLAGLPAACAYLSRTAGIALLVAVPPLFLWKREWRRAAAFAAGMLPAVIGWTLWNRSHLMHTADPTLIYYTDYLRYQFLNVGFDNLAVVLWKNLDQLLYGMGSLVLPKVLDGLPVKILTEALAVAMIVGAVRLARRGIAVDYALFALVSAGILLIWHFPPNERFVLPFFPLLLAGLVAEVEYIVRAARRHKDFGQRVAGMMISGAMLFVLATGLALQLYLTFVFLEQSAEKSRAKLRDQRAAYSWISANLSPSATILSYDDALLYLYTGRRGNYLPLLPRWWYAEDHASIIGAYRNLQAYCRNRGLEYVYFTSEDLQRETGDEDRHEVERVMHENRALKPIFQAGIGTIYKP